MLTVTESAGTHLANLLTTSDAPDDAAVRIAHDDRQGWSLLLDNVEPGDQTYEHEGRTVLLIDERAAALLGDVTLDVQLDEEEAHLTISPSESGEEA